MALNRQAEAMLQLLDARGDKPVPESTPDEVRASNWQWVDFMGEPEPVAAVQDTYIPGPTASYTSASTHRKEGSARSHASCSSTVAVGLPATST